MDSNSGPRELRIRQAAAFLAEHLQAQGLPAVVNRELVHLGFGDLTCRVRADESSTIKPPLVPLWFDISLPDHHVTIVESLSGPGTSMDESVQSSVHQLLRGTLGPVRRLYGVQARGDDVQQGSINSSAGENSSIAWDVFIGPPIVYGSDLAETRGVAASIVKRAHLVDVLDEVTGLLADRRLHWCKTFLARINGGEPLGHVTLDNLDSPDGFRALSQRRLPPTGQTLARQFTLVRPAQ